MKFEEQKFRSALVCGTTGMRHVFVYYVIALTDSESANHTELHNGGLCTHFSEIVLAVSIVDTIFDFEDLIFIRIEKKTAIETLYSTFKSN